MAKKKKAGVTKRSSPKKAAAIGKQPAVKTPSKARKPAILGTEPDVITLAKENFWFEVIGSNLQNPIFHPTIPALVFTDDNTGGKYPIPNTDVSFSDQTVGGFTIKVKGIARRSMELRGSGKLRITIIAGPNLPAGSRDKAEHQAKAKTP